MKRVRSSWPFGRIATLLLVVFFGATGAVGVAQVVGGEDPLDPTRGLALPCDILPVPGTPGRAERNIKHQAYRCGIVGTDIEFQSRATSDGKEHDYAFVGSVGNGLRIFDITDPKNPVLAGQHQQPRLPERRAGARRLRVHVLRRRLGRAVEPLHLPPDALPGCRGPGRGRLPPQVQRRHRQVRHRPRHLHPEPARRRAHPHDPSERQLPVHLELVFRLGGGRDRPSRRAEAGRHAEAHVPRDRRVARLDDRPLPRHRHVQVHRRSPARWLEHARRTEWARAPRRPT